MKTIKRLSSDWDIYADTVTINGNLVVIGNTTSVESVETVIYDNFITLAAGQASPLLNAGFEINRGKTAPAVGIRWNEALKYWQYTNDGVIWKNFSQMIVEEDKSPRLGGNLRVQDSNGNSWTITSDTGRNMVIYAGMDSSTDLKQIPEDGTVVLGPSVRLPINDTDPARRYGYSTIYAKRTGTGDTGVYVSNDKTVGDELITKRKAFVYSLIL